MNPSSIVRVFDLKTCTERYACINEFMIIKNKLQELAIKGAHLIRVIKRCEALSFAIPALIVCFENSILNNFIQHETGLFLPASNLSRIVVPKYYW
jgi:hypothetical protein